MIICTCALHTNNGEEKDEVEFLAATDFVLIIL